MMFVTGPAFSGKKSFARQVMGWNEDELIARAATDVQNLCLDDDLTELADELARKEVVISCELGAGVVPVDAAQRAQREAAGRLACLLAERADVVVRVCCGLPQVLKGVLP